MQLQEWLGVLGEQGKAAAGRLCSGRRGSDTQAAPLFLKYTQHRSRAAPYPELAAGDRAQRQ